MGQVRSLFVIFLLAVACCAETAEAQFQAKILPVLLRDCQGCHGAGMTLSHLDLRSRESLLRGGVRGAAVIPGKPGDSILIQVLEGRGLPQMPPGGSDKKLPPATISAFRDWIAGGAPWPQQTAAGNGNYKMEDLWAFRRLRPFEPKETIDRFLDAKLKERGLVAAPKADRRTLIRRVTLDLTGLPPTPEEINAFDRDRAPYAWGRLVDRLLASPRYGERWGRHWLDVVRYADTNGYSNDFERPNAWRYRDYVIRSFNSDKPYDRFVREQIAGDELYPENGEAMVATGFLRSGPWEHTGMSVEAVTRQLFLDDVTHATASTFLGLTLGCAKCHDHKFDPIPTRDYYRMQAVFATTEFVRPALPFLPAENTADLPAGAKSMRDLYKAAQERVGEYRRMSGLAVMKKLGLTRLEDVPEAELNRAMANGIGLDPEQFEVYKLHQKHAQLYKESLDRFEPKAFAVASGPSDTAPDGGPSLKYPKFAQYKPAVVHILPGGNLQSPAEPVTPGVLSAPQRHGDYAEATIPDGVSGRRAALANWISRKDNPLTARVMVNRIWQYHFGRGLAADTSNLGKMGEKPTHPELLDWLAGYFIEHGWSVKAVHRAILHSAAYQRDSQHPQFAVIGEKDPGNAMLSYFAPRRLEAEVLRDSILAVSGEISLETGGPGVFPQINEDVARQPQHRMGSLAPAYQESPRKSQRNRRTIYTFQQRSLINPMIDVFNGPSLDLSCERRESSTVPTQAFALFNSQFVHDMALAFAARLQREAPTVDGQIRRAFQLATGRDPEPREVAVARKQLADATKYHRVNPAPARPLPKPLRHTITSELTGESFSFAQAAMLEPFEPNVHPSQVTAATRALSDFTLVLLNSSAFAYMY